MKDMDTMALAVVRSACTGTPSARQRDVVTDEGGGQDSLGWLVNKAHQKLRRRHRGMHKVSRFT